MTICIRNRQPTAREIIKELNNPTENIGWCITHSRTGVYQSKPAEIYIGAFGTWLRADGSYMSCALNGTKRWGWYNRCRLARHVRRWAERERIDRIVKATVDRIVNATDPLDTIKAFEEDLE